MESAAIGAAHDTARGAGTAAVHMNSPLLSNAAVNCKVSIAFCIAKFVLLQADAISGSNPALMAVDKIGMMNELVRLL
jgi:hypothetical protein